VAWRRRVGAPEVNQQRPCFETRRDARASIRGGRDPRGSRTMLRERRGRSGSAKGARGVRGALRRVSAEARATSHASETPA
jgi:hypothetical protein